MTPPTQTPRVLLAEVYYHTIARDECNSYERDFNGVTGVDGVPPREGRLAHAGCAVEVEEAAHSRSATGSEGEKRSRSTST